jgi:hypothetical protein
MGKARNPFHWRGTVTDPEAFVGREREMSNIFARLQTLACVSVVGQRRIGKSSLAYQACVRAPKQLGSECRAAFVDLLSSKHHTLDGLLRAVVEGLGESGWEPTGESSPEKLASFEDAIRQLRKGGCMPVVFLDEFEGLASRVEQFGDDLLESWRSLGNDGQMGFVATSARPMEEVTKQSGLTSSFYNIFAQMRLGELREPEAREFARWALRVGGLEAGDDAFILRVGGEHPLRLQVAAWHLFEARQADEVDFGRLADEAEAEIAGMMQS